MDLLNAVGTVAEAVTGMPRVYVREELRGVIDNDNVPFCIVAKGGPEEPVDYAFTDLVQYRYPVLVLLVWKYDRDFNFSTEDENEITVRQALRDALDKRTLTNVSSITDADLEPLDLTGFGDDPNTPYKVTGFRVQYYSWETRT